MIGFLGVTGILFSIAFSMATMLTIGLAGNWTGKSICTITNSLCHDNHVIYRVTKPDSDGKLKIQMDKVVGGKPKLMGTLNCMFDKEVATITCPVNDDIWKFVVAGNKMEGTLTLADGRLYRRISVTKDER